MRAVVQRVTEAGVTVDGKARGRIGLGLLVYLGVALDDGRADADWLAEKIAALRIFDDADGRMNLSLAEVPGGPCAVLAVSQFTLMGDARKGRRPSWSKAAPPEKARELYEYFMGQIRGRGLVCESGEFQARMMVSSVNCGPVTILLDSRDALRSASLE
ncbi:MAG: D-aminoacyl-tRNA deacylase [Treponema sp.]|nr:D-aminoacyl-tRNA deacylase [Treponema sp.]